jgi:LPXTG-motif cell wall-anchored protein
VPLCLVASDVALNVAQSEERLPDTGESIKQNGLLGGIMTLLVGLGLMKRKKKKDVPLCLVASDVALNVD